MRKRHIYIPDTQIHPGTPVPHLSWIARFVGDHRQPDHIQFGGDWWDMPSLSSWSKRGSLETEGRRIQADRDAGFCALSSFFDDLAAHTDCLSGDVTMGMTLGNHEYRLNRAVSEDPRLQGLIDVDTFYGLHHFPQIEVAEFMAPQHRDGVTYCHLFDLTANGDTTGRRAGQPTAATQVRRVRGSSVAGHKQGYDVAHLTHPYSPRWERETFAVIAGSCYLHAEAYRGPTDGYERRGIVVIEDLNGFGIGSPRFISLDYLRERYS